MLDPTELLELERRSLGRPVQLVNAATIIAGTTEVMVVVYDSEPTETDRGSWMHTRRAAVMSQAEGETPTRTGLIVASAFTDSPDAQPFRIPRTEVPL